MPNERDRRLPLSVTSEAFGLTYNEELFDRLTHNRFLEILNHQASTVHSLAVDYNQYGEFLFVTVSRPSKLQPAVATFWGLGFHEHRDRWLTEEWFWYTPNYQREREQLRVPKPEARRLIEERHAELAHYGNTQSPRGRLFETLADLTDEDGAYSELEDMGDLADWLFDGDE